MNSLKRKLLLSVSTFIFALLSFTGATVAWFSLSDEVTIAGFEMNISTGENLLVLLPGVDGSLVEHWTNDVLEAQIIALFVEQRKAAQAEGDALYLGYSPSDLRFEPLTSINGYQFYNRQLPTSSTVNSALYSSEDFRYQEPIVKTHQLKYFTIDLTFRSDSSTSSLNVYLNKGNAPLIVPTLIDPAGSESLVGAMRIGLVGWTPPVYSEDPEPVLVTPGAFNQNLMIYEQDAPIAKSNSFTRTSNFKTQPTWLDVVQPVQTTTGALYDFTADTQLNSFLFTLDPAVDGNILANAKKVRVTIWLEGWDINTTDSLWQQGLIDPATLAFTVSMNFKGIPQ